MVPLLRHFPTKFNSGTPGEERSRGHLKIPPDPEAMEKLGPGAAETLRELNVSSLRASSLPRARISGKWIADELGIPMEVTNDLETWDTGDKVAGKLEKETIPLRKKWIKYPDTKPPGGEPFEDFINRATAEFKTAAEYNRKHPDAPKALVVHGHHVIAAEELFNGKEVDPNELDTLDEEFPPGSVMLLHIRPNDVELERIHPKGFDKDVRR